MNTLIAVLIVIFSASPSWGTTPFVQEECEQILTPQYSIFPLHRKLFEVRKSLGKELKLLDYTILEDRSLGYTGINMKFPGKRILFYAYVSRKPAFLSVSLNEGFAKQVDEEVTPLRLYDGSNLSEAEGEYREKVMALALSLIIPATFPFEQDVIIELKGFTSLSPDEIVEDALLKQHTIAIPSLAFRSIGRLGYHRLLEKPDVSVSREISFEKFNEISQYNYQFRIRVGFRREN